MNERDNPDHKTVEGSQELPTVADAIELRNAMILTLVDEQARMRRSVRRWLIAGFVVLCLVLGTVIWFVQDIRSTQVSRGQTVLCQTKGVDGLLKDVPLAFAGDHNRGDYAKIPHGCPVSR